MLVRLDKYMRITPYTHPQPAGVLPTWVVSGYINVRHGTCNDWSIDKEKKGMHNIREIIFVSL